MSERKAKQARKETVEEHKKNKTDKKTIWFRVISVVLIVALAGFAAYAIVDTVKDSGSQQQATDADQTDTEQTDTSTLAGLAESMGITYDELVENWGLNAENFSADMATEEAYDMMTLENIAKMSETDLEEFKENYGLPADVDTTIPNTQLSTGVMMKAYGIPYTLEELAENGLSEGINEDTLWGDAKESVIDAANAKMTAEQEAATAESETDAETESETEADGAQEGE